MKKRFKRRNNYENKTAKRGRTAVLSAVPALFCICAVVAGCKSNGITDNADIIERNSFTAGQLESTVESLDRTTSDSRKRIADIITRSREVEDGVDRLEFLFTEYESETDRLLAEIDNLRGEIENSRKNNNVGSNSTLGDDSNKNTSEHSPNKGN